MSKIDLNAKEKATTEVKTQTGNSTEVEKLTNAEPAKTPAQPTELTDNTSDNSEDTQKTEEKATEEPKKAGSNTGTVVVTYIGSGIWKDETGALWASTVPASASTIINERQYSVDEYESREDIKFMVGYGAMKTIFVK